MKRELIARANIESLNATSGFHWNDGQGRVDAEVLAFQKGCSAISNEYYWRVVATHNDYRPHAQ